MNCNCQLGKRVQITIINTAKNLEEKEIYSSICRKNIDFASEHRLIIIPGL